MPIEVRRLYANVADFLDLRVPFLLDFAEQHAAARQPQQQTLWPALELAAIIEQSGHGFAIGNGFAIAQVQMHADAQARSRMRQLHARLKRGAIGQQGSARYDSVAVRVGNPTVDAVRPTQVIRVYNEVSQILPVPVFRPVLPDSYPFVCLYSTVPLTVFPLNFSMAFRGKNGC